MTPAGASFKLGQIWPVVARRRMPLLCIFVAVFASASLAALLWPSSYVSTGTILIEQQELPTDFVRSTVSSYATQRIQIISQRVMTTDNLLNIVKRYDLYTEMRGKSREEIVDAMRRDTKLQMISADVIDPRSGGPIKATIAFAIAYANRSPQIAATVANELVSLYLQQNIDSRQRSSREAVSFLSGEGARVGDDIKVLEAKLAELKRKHGNELPELKQLNSQTLDRAADELHEIDSQLQSVGQQLIYLDAQLAQINPQAQVYTSTGERVQTPSDRLKVLRTEYARAVALYSPDHPDVLRMRREMMGLAAKIGADATDVGKVDSTELLAAQSELARAKQRYSADHPDIVRLERLVESLQRQPAETGAAGADGASAEAADNPVYIQLMAQREASLNQRRGLESRRATLHNKLNDYEGRLAQMPLVERDYVGIVRDLESAQQQYRAIRQKQMDAQISVNLEVERKGERFTLIDPPMVPGRPVSPNRKLIVVMGLVAALGAAVGMVVLLEMLDGSIRGRSDLEQLLSVPPLAMIPVMLTSVDREASRRQRRYGVYAAAVCLAVAVVLLHFVYRPLDVIWMVALRRLGIEG